MLDRPRNNEIGVVLADRYQTERILGQGGFGVVYEAKDLTIGRPVALKVLRSELFHRPDALQRFQREAQVSQRLEHPNTIRVYDVGVSPDGFAFIAFELLRGKTLSDVLAAEGALPVERVGRIASQVLMSLMDAHARGIVHRDIKPSNIFLCEFSGSPDFVKVLDFGIAKAARDDEQTSDLTETGQVLGTPRYMAPEQARARGAIGPAADLYALGLVLSEALAGKPVYTGTALEVCMEQVSPVPVPHRPEVLASPLGPVIERATRKVPAERFASADEMRRALEEALQSPAAQGKLVLAAQPSTSVSSQGAATPEPSLPPATGPSATAAYTPAPAPVPGAAPVEPAPTAASKSRGALMLGLGLAAGMVITGLGALLVIPKLTANREAPSTQETAAAPPSALAAQPATAPVQATAPSPVETDKPSDAARPSSPGTRPQKAQASPPPAASSALEPQTPLGAFNANAAYVSMDVFATGAKNCSSGKTTVSAAVTVTFSPVGKAIAVSVGAPFAGTPAGACIENMFRAARSPAFAGTQPMSASKSYFFAY
jgi:serine/threonine-protein kinase